MDHHMFYVDYKHAFLPPSLPTPDFSRFGDQHLAFFKEMTFLVPLSNPERIVAGDLVV